MHATTGPSTGGWFLLAEEKAQAGSRAPELEDTEESVPCFGSCQGVMLDMPPRIRGSVADAEIGKCFFFCVVLALYCGRDCPHWWTQATILWCLRHKTVVASAGEHLKGPTPGSGAAPFGDFVGREVLRHCWSGTMCLLQNFSPTSLLGLSHRIDELVENSVHLIG